MKKKFFVEMRKVDCSLNPNLTYKRNPKAGVVIFRDQKICLIYLNVDFSKH